MESDSHSEAERKIRSTDNITPNIKEIQIIKDSTYTKQEMNVELTIMGLESEKRMIQATDRKLLDVHRQTQIDQEIKKLKSN
jgi:hypothetical protein